ncbi:hypothetical protein [Sphingomonas paeninsulae]|uniref:hypothetical protein n=1 Tax=Sphingomonas paeninsulae TaxID=2319844 RepID=UPI0013CE6E9C|nr:hypothetical protein [Sphingomonas paeninsulae]
MDDDILAELATNNNTETVVMTSAERGEPYAGQGYVLSGNGEQVTFKRPGHISTQCKAN